MALSEVPDPVFASGVVGGGCALIPDSASECLTVHSPINGVVTKLKPHAAIITSTQGISILIHLGIDTVSLHGKGFAALVDEGEVPVDERGTRRHDVPLVDEGREALAM